MYGPYFTQIGQLPLGALLRTPVPRLPGDAPPWVRGPEAEGAPYFAVRGPAAVVAVSPNDPALQGRAPGVRLNDRPLPRSLGAQAVADLPNGVVVEVRSAPVFDREGRQWRVVFVPRQNGAVNLTARNVDALNGGVSGWAPFVDPDGRTFNFRPVPGAPAWPSHALGARGPFNRFG